jgi:ABC-type phosphonate transport system ATPase subunit
MHRQASEINSDEMKDMFKESIDGVKKLIIQQVILVEQEPQQGLRCRVSVRFHVSALWLS